MIRDQNTRALISNDAASLNKYKVEREKARKFSKLEETVRNLEKRIELLEKNQSNGATKSQ